MNKIVRIGKLSFAEMENYANKKNSNFYDSMIAEVVGFAITQKKNLSVEEINQIAGALCDSDELNETINGIIQQYI